MVDTTFYSAREQTRNEQISVTGTSSTIADSRFKGEERQMYVLKNTSPNAADIITINLGMNAAVANEGIVLRQYDTYAESPSEGFQVWQGAIQAICATANGKLSILER